MSAAPMRARVSAEDYRLIEAMSCALPQIVASIEQERMTMRKLRHLLFGAKTEQTDRVCPPAAPPALIPPVPKPQHQGHGRIKSTETMSVELQRRINTIMQKYPDTEHDLLITVSPEVMHRLRTKDEQTLVEMERRHHGRLSFKVDPAQHRETVLITNAQTGKEMK